MSRKPPPRGFAYPVDDEVTDVGIAASEPAFPAWDDESTLPGRPHDQDQFEVSGAAAKSVVLNPVAPEVSPGRWRERAFVPREQLPREEIIGRVEDAVTMLAIQRGDVGTMRTALKEGLLPLLQQAMEHAGGDGIDAHLMRFADVRARPARATLLTRLVANLERVNRASQPKALLDAAVEIAQTVRAALEAEAPRRLSLQLLEHEYEGRIDVATFLSILLSSNEELEVRTGNVSRTLESLRAQLRALPGASPEGLMSNFARLKLEKQVLESELSRRRAGR